MMLRDSHASSRTRLLGVVLLALAFFGWMPKAEAASPNCTASSATLSLPGTINVPANLAPGPIPNATGTASITFNCSGLPATTSHAADYTATIQAGQNLATRDSTNNPNGPGITFATGITGLALLVTATPVQATSNTCLACGPTSTAGYVPGSVTAPAGTSQGSYSGAVVANYTAQLIKTTSGNVPPGTIGPITLIPFWWYIAGGSVDSTSQSLHASLNLGTITITAPTCAVAAGTGLTVPLPGVETTDLAANGSVAGTTPFSIAITGCPDGLSVATNTFSGGNVDRNTGNLQNSGSARNVEVRLLNGAGGSANAGSAINLHGTTAKAQNSGTFPVVNDAVTLNYFAQYYATGKATAGTVSASVQYTITYQ